MHIGKETTVRAAESFNHFPPFYTNQCTGVQFFTWRTEAFATFIENIFDSKVLLTTVVSDCFILPECITQLLFFDIQLILWLARFAGQLSSVARSSRPPDLPDTRSQSPRSGRPAGQPVSRQLPILKLIYGGMLINSTQIPVIPLKFPVNSTQINS